jgi:hypothetical protein
MTDGKTRARPETKDFTITNRDVVGLINALSEMAVKLTRGQWGLLLSILAAAAGNVEVGEDNTKGTFSGVGVKVDGGVITYPRNKDVKELRRQLRAAYMPAKEPGAPLAAHIVPPPPK